MIFTSQRTWSSFAAIAPTIRTIAMRAASSAGKNGRILNSITISTIDSGFIKAVSLRKFVSSSVTRDAQIPFVFCRLPWPAVLVVAFRPVPIPGT